MSDIWVTSDTHFFHANILKFTDRNGSLIRPNFATVSEMNEHMADMWNESIKPGDKVYHLGDVFVGNEWETFKTFFDKLNGKKRLIVGNHDNIEKLVKLNFFQKTYMWRMFPEQGLLFSHVPVHQSGLWRNGKPLTNVHGHIHQNNSPQGFYRNVCVEKTQYKPVHFEDLLTVRPKAQYEGNTLF